MTEPSAPPRASTAITLLCWIVIVGAVAFIAGDRAWKAKPNRAAPAAVADTGAPSFEMVLTGRMAVSVAQASATDDRMRLQLRTALDRVALKPADQLAEVIAVRELSGPAAARKLLEPFTATPDSVALTALYAADSPAVLSDAQRAGLSRDLGYFGRLAATQGGPADAPVRRALLAEANRTVVTVTVASALILLAVGLGVGGLVTLVILFTTGALRFAYAPPTDRAAPTTVWLETFALWIVTYILFSLATALLHLHLPILAVEGSVAALSAGVALGWPMWRTKRSLADVRQSLGLTGGQGLLTEVAWGIAGYVSGLPVIVVGGILTYLLAKLAGAHPTHPIEGEFGDGMTGGRVLALLVTAAVLAPLLEETLFRGALYAHLRQRHRAWLSAGIVALIFAAIHPQGWTTIPVLGSIALVLAFLREWRGSLIAPMTAHALNNGTLVAVMVLALR